MDYYCRIQDAVDYVEENLTSQIVLEDVANKAYFSVYHFHRIFQAMVGSSVNSLGHTYEYIYSTWLTKSGYELAPAHDFELYDQRFNLNSEESEMDIYIPIK